MFDALLTGGTIVNAEGSARGEVAIVGQRVAAILPPGESAEAGTVVDVGGRMLLPGLVDAHAHLREPGLTHKEDFGSGTHAAAIGGVTTILDMPTDEPWTATPEQLAYKTALARGRLHVDVGFQIALTRNPRNLAKLLEAGPVSFELFTADVPDAFLFDGVNAMREVLEQLAGVDTLVGVSPGDQSILVSSLERGGTGVAAFLSSRPPLAEANGVARAVLAAASTGARIHIRQINSRLGVESWRRLRGMADASVETTVQNLFFSEDDYAMLGPGMKASPPFRSPSDLAALRQALRDGLIDLVATDHAPHSPAEKAAVYPSFADVPGGMPGLQTLLPMVLVLVEEGTIELKDLVRMCARNPAQRFGLGRRKGAIAAGFDADILVMDPGRAWTVRNTDQVSRAGYTPFDGRVAKAQLEAVYLRGIEIVRDGVLTGKPRGMVVSRGS